METNDELLNRHPFSRKGIFNKYACKKMIKSKATYCSLFTLVLLATYLLYNQSDDGYLSLLKKITDLSLSLFPSLLGFCIGGYALIIGVGNIEVLKKMSSPMKNRDNWSYYQILSSIFAISIIIQCATLLFSLMISVAIDLDIEPINNKVGLFTNIALISIIYFFSIMSILLLYYTIINIFNFGQIAHLSVRLEKTINEANQQTSNNTDDANA